MTISDIKKYFILAAMPFFMACAAEELPGEGDNNEGDGGDTQTPVTPPDGTQGDPSKVETYVYPIGKSAPSDITDPKIILPSSLYRVTAEGEEQFVFATGASAEEISRIGTCKNTAGIDQPNICAFGCSETVKVEISLVNGTINTCEVMPVSKKPVYSIADNKVTLFMKPYDRYVVEINGNEKNLLLIFANPLQSEMGVSENDPNVIRYKAGQIYNKEVIYPQDGQTIFIEGGAIVYGRILAQNKSVHVNGPGVLYCYPEYNYKGVYLLSCHDCSLKNTIVLNKSAWATAVCQSTNITIDNWHAISTCNPYDGSGVNNDTCDLFGSNTATITRGFSYSHDDAFCIKSHKFQWKGKVYDVTYDDCISYAVDGGNGIDLGYETNEDVSRITYKNIYICRSNGTRGEMRRGGIALHNAAAGVIDDVTYENIYVEDPREYGFHMAILDSGYSIGHDANGKDMYWTKPGYVKNVKVKNLHILKTPPYGYYISGYDSSHTFNIEFDGLYIAGKRISSLDEFDKLPNTTIKNANVTIK